MDLLALLGFVVLLAGLHLAWQVRQTILYWAAFAVSTWRAALRPDPTGQARPGAAPRPRELRNLRLLGSVGLIFLGQLLLVLALVF